MRPVMIADRMSGMTTRRSVVAVPALRVEDASSRLGSSCVRAATPLRIPTGIPRKMNASTMIRPVPVICNAPALKARM